MKARRDSNGHVTYRCPCGDLHTVIVSGPSARWTWNGDTERPTFAPSVLVTTGPSARWTWNGSCWCTYNAEHPDDPAPFGCYRCHSYVRDGVVEFLPDCTHALAGKSVPLGDWEVA